MIFQDARSALNPRRKVRELVGEGLAIAGMPRREIAARVDETLLGVGLDPARVGERRAAELSGGQCQRVAIARAMVVRPAVLVGMYGFTNCESQLAALLARGTNLNDAAEHLGVSINTVKTHLRGVYEKMGTNKQARVVAQLNHSTARLL